MLFKDKKGLSVMIGYVLLIAGAIAMGAIVFVWLQSYVPNEEQKCDDGVSILVKDYVCEKDEGITLSLTIKNTGRFAVEGFFIRAAENELADVSLSEFVIESGDYIDGGGRVYIEGSQENNLEPSSEKEFVFEISDAEMANIKFIEIIPTRMQKINERNRLLTCADAKIREEINCN